MKKFAQKVNEIFLSLGILFVYYGLVINGGNSPKGFLRNSEFLKISLNKNQIFRMASMTESVIAYPTLTVLDEHIIDISDKVEKYSPETDNFKIVYKDENIIKFIGNSMPIIFHHLLSCSSGHAFVQDDPVVSALLSKKKLLQ